MSAEIIETIAGVRAWIATRRRSGRTIAFVPTMGALHQGHARLIDEARKAADAVVVSIFVNPLQFDRKDDLERYPRTLASDVRICNELSVDVVFAPSADEMYPEPPVCTVEVRRISDTLCGRFRPGHFAGVATVVTKLFQIVQPDSAYFGEKDAQQLAIIRRLVADLDMPVQIVGVATVREADGLALSSRNARLSPEERQRAPVLYQALRAAGQAIAQGHRDAGAVERLAAGAIPQDATLRLEYLEIVDPATLQPVETITRPVLVAAAMWAGSTRLIDNLLCAPPESQ
jgi:pantoate--beta-alanine ligase